MEYREFLENVRKEVESRYDSNVSVTLNHVMKNNGTELDGITIMEKIRISHLQYILILFMTDTGKGFL